MSEIQTVGPQHHLRQLPLLERAARAAVGCWWNIEKRLCEGVQNAEGPDQIFPPGWLFEYWKVGRTLSKKNKGAIRELLFRRRPELMTARVGRSAWELVQQLAGEIEPMNWCRPTSLVSKYAFSCAPTVFAPYDTYVRGQLHTQDHDYVSYSEAFARRKADVQRELATLICSDRNVGLSAWNLPIDGSSMSEELFVARATDWRLLLQGGYDDTNWPVHCGLIVRNAS